MKMAIHREGVYADICEAQCRMIRMRCATRLACTAVGLMWAAGKPRCCWMRLGSRGIGVLRQGW